MDEALPMAHPANCRQHFKHRTKLALYEVDVVLIDVESDASPADILATIATVPAPAKGSSTTPALGHEERIRGVLFQLALYADLHWAPVFKLLGLIICSMTVGALIVARPSSKQ
jgi:hypothetical protein